MQPKTLYDKIWESHVVVPETDAPAILFIDLHLIHEVTSPQAFDELRARNLRLRRPDLTLGTVDHSIPTTTRTLVRSDDPLAYDQVKKLDTNCAEFEVQLFGIQSDKQGIVHVIGPELGATQPGKTIVCGDSHTSTHGAFGALAFGIGTTEVGHVLASQCLLQRKAKNFEVRIDGQLREGITAKDVILYVISQIGIGGGTGCVFEFTGSAVRAMNMDARMTLCNMSIEGGARAGLVAPDETTFEYLKGRPMAPKAGGWEQAVSYWKTLPSDAGAKYDAEVNLKTADIAPQVTWGTSPQDVLPITGAVPNPGDVADEDKRRAMERALDYMGLKPGTKLTDVPIDRVFIGSCTNGRIEDLREVAKIAQGKKVASSVNAM